MINTSSMKKNFLRIKSGNVELINNQGQRIKTYYSKGDAKRVDWHEEDKESVEVLLENGKILILNRGCQRIKTIC